MPPDDFEIESVEEGGSAARYEEPPRAASSDEDKLSVVEALLFVSPEPLSAGAICEITGFDAGAVREMLNRLAESYAEREGGLVIREVAGGFGFYAAPLAAPYISRMIRSQVNPRLTRAALETIAIVAYLQPISRGVVAEIRGVQSEGVMRTLEDRGLVKAMGKGGPPGYAVLYGTTGKFLERFGLMSLDELPALEQFAPDEATIEKIKRSLSWELEEEALVDRGAGDREGPEDTGEGGAGLEEGGGAADPRGEGEPEW
jgi:segregation and condensation protein B